MESHWHHHHCNKRSCCSIRHSCHSASRHPLSCSPHTAHKHNLGAWHHKGCKVFHPWFCFVICPSSLCIKIWGKLPSQGEGEQVRLSPALPLQKRCQLWQLSPPPWLRSLLRGQRMLHVLQLEEFQFPYGFCQHGLSDHAASLIQSHIDQPCFPTCPTPWIPSDNDNHLGTMRSSWCQWSLIIIILHDKSLEFGVGRIMVFLFYILHMIFNIWFRFHSKYIFHFTFNSNLIQPSTVNSQEPTS